MEYLFHHQLNLNPARPLKEVEKILNYKFKNKNLLLQAFTDATYKGEKSDSYELLEYLGDSILNMVISNEFVKLYPNESPGSLTRLRSANVENERLAKVALKHKLYLYIRHNKPKLEQQIQEFEKAIKKDKAPSHVPKILADVVESTIGAIFKDCNSIDTVWKVIKPLLEPIIPLDKLKNHPVTELTEMCQKMNLNLKSKDTWEKNKYYCFLIEGEEVGRGKDPMRKETARYCAAQDALNNFSPEKI